MSLKIDSWIANLGPMDNDPRCSRVKIARNDVKIKDFKKMFLYVDYNENVAVSDNLIVWSNIPNSAVNRIVTDAAAFEKSDFGRQHLSADYYDSLGMLRSDNWWLYDSKAVKYTVQTKNNKVNSWLYN